MESQGFDWFALSDSTGSVKVEKDGAGLKKLWIEQLQQFSGVGADMAAGLARRYPSPLQLFKVRSLHGHFKVSHFLQKLFFQAFTDCPNQDDGEKMLQDFSVTFPIHINLSISYFMEFHSSGISWGWSSCPNKTIGSRSEQENVSILYLNQRR